MTGQSHAASTPETLLFESIGEMVAGLSYSHTIITVPLHDLEKQVNDYRGALEKEFNQDHLKTVLNQALANGSHVSDPGPHAVNIFKKWTRIGATHLNEVDALRQRVSRLFELLPPTLNDMEDRITADFQAPPVVLSEWSVRGTPLERSYEDFFKKPLSSRNKRALPVIALSGAALAFGGAGTLFGRLGMKGTARVQDQLLTIQNRQETIIKAAWETDRQVGILRKEIMDMILANAISDQFDTAVLLARLRTYFSQLETKVSQHEHLLQQLQHQKLAVDFLDQRALRALALLFNQAKKRAKSLGFHLLLQRLPNQGILFLQQRCYSSLRSTPPTNCTGGLHNETVSATSVSATVLQRHLHHP